MTIEELAPGQAVKIEVIIGNSSFELNSSVVGTNNTTGILVEPYLYDNNVVDFSVYKKNDIVFNVHCIDKVTGRRMAWRNVALSLINYKGKSYYSIDSRGFGSRAVSSDRRKDDRSKLFCTGDCSFAGNKVPVNMIDISDSGVAFLARNKIVDKGDAVGITFSDVAHGTDFFMEIYCKIVRMEERADGVFYAGSILDKHNKFLAYLCFKRLDEKQSKAEGKL